MKFLELNADATLFGTDDGRTSFNNKGGQFEAMMREVRAGTSEIIPYVAPPLPDVADIPLSTENRLAILEAKAGVMPADHRAARQDIRDRGEG